MRREEFGGSRSRVLSRRQEHEAMCRRCLFFFFQAEDGIRDLTVTGVQTCALPIFADEGEDVKATRAQHPVIEEEEVGVAMDGAVGKGSLALEILDGLFTALEVDEEIGRASCRERV